MMDARKAPNHDLRKKFLVSEEGSVFVFGCLMLILGIGTIVLLWQANDPLWSYLMSMSFAQIFAGRAAAVAQGTQIGLDRSVIVFLATYVDALTVYITYPVLVFSYRNLVEGPLFQKHMKPLFESAERGLARFARYDVAGIFLFVWLPFHMTGVVVGAILGYLLGMKTWVNMATVTFATMTASICWAYAYDTLFDLLGGIDPVIPVVITVLIIVGLVGARWYKAWRNRKKLPAG